MSDVSDRLHNIMSRKRPPAADIPPPSHEDKVSTAIVRYCDAAADEIEKEVARANERVKKFTEDAHKTAANLRQLGQMQCEHILAFSATVKNAVEAARDISASLTNYMATPTKARVPQRTEVIDAVAKELNGGTELPA